MVHLYNSPHSLYLHHIVHCLFTCIHVYDYSKFIYNVIQAMHSTETPPETPCYTDNPDTPPSAWEYKTTADGTG